MILADLWVDVFQLRKCRWVTGDDRDFMLGMNWFLRHSVSSFSLGPIGVWS